jgi:tRNA A37 methylthiotransferase MiaB
MTVERDGTAGELRRLPVLQPETPGPSAGDMQAIADELRLQAGPQGGAPKKVNITSLGCVENALTSSRFSRLFELNNWQLVDSAAEADLVLVNTCGVSNERAQDSVRAIEELRGSLQERAKLIVTGCLVAIDPESLEGATAAGAQVVSPRNTAPIEELLGSSRKLQDVRTNEVPERFMRPRLRALNLVAMVVRVLGRLGVPYPSRLDRVLSAFEQQAWHYVHVATGCAHVCAYCAIRFAKGYIRSEPRQQIVDEVARGVANGQNRIVLVGDDTGSYGLDSDTDLAKLLGALVKIPGDFGIHVRNLEPMGFLRVLDGLERVVASGKIRAITVPLQSGSDRLLAAMGREYRLAPAMEALARLKRQHPELLILTHVMVGFPGETRGDFRATLRLIKSFEFDGVAPDCFSPRKGTAAARMEDQIPFAVRRWRYYRTIWLIVWRVYIRACLGLGRRVGVRS